MSNERTPLLQEQGFRPSTQDENTNLARTLSGTSAIAPDVSVEAGNGNAKPEQPLSPWLIDTTPLKFWTMYIPILAVYFVATFDSTLMASSHPVITSYFHSSNSASWLSTAFMLTSTTFQPLYGRLSDTFGRRPLWIFALVTFGVTTAWCGLAQSMTSFIIARAFCGIGAGGVMGMGSIMTNDLIAISHRGAYQAYINIFYGLGSSSGAAFGGFLCDALGWRWAFGIQVPFILIILLFGIFTVPKDLGPNLARKTDQKWYQILREFDLAGSFFLTLTTACLILGLNLGGNVLPWKHPLIITSLVLCIFTAGILIRVESRAKRPVMPLALLATSPKANLLFSNFLSQIGALTILFNAPLYFQAVKLDSASVSGFRLAIPSLLLTVFAVSTGLWVNRTGRLKLPQILGAMSMLLSAILLSSMWTGIPTWAAMLFIVPSSVGQGLMFPMTTLSLLAISKKPDQAVVTAALGVWRNLGNVMGVAFSSLILQNALRAYLDQFVTGPEKDDIIQKVRKSVRAITGLDGLHQGEVIKAYEAALRWTFISAILSYVILNLLLWPIKLPRLGHDKVAADEEDEDEE